MFLLDRLRRKVLFPATEFGQGATEVLAYGTAVRLEEGA